MFDLGTDEIGEKLQRIQVNQNKIQFEAVKIGTKVVDFRNQLQVDVNSSEIK